MNAQASGQGVTRADLYANLCRSKQMRSQSTKLEPLQRVSRPLCVLVALAMQSCGASPKPEQRLQSAPKAQPATAPMAHAADKRESVTTAAAPATVAGNAPAASPSTVAAEPARVEPATTDVQKVLAYDPKDPLADLEAADALDKMAQHADSPAKSVTPARGRCAVMQAGQRVWPASGPTAISALGRDFVVAGYAQRDGREQLFVVHARDGALPQPIAAFDVVPPHPRARVAPPGITVRDENDLSVAFVDGQGKLWARRLRIERGGGGAPIEIASGVDTRFPPALATSQDRTLLAWTSATTPMHTHLAVISLEGSVLSRHDVTPTGLGATAPAFVSGANPPVLVALDAHEGMSPILRVDIGSHGDPQTAQIALPVGMVSSPPELAAASTSIGTYVAYTGLGSAATSAIGLVAIAPVAGTPQALVKGTAYGALHVAAAAGPRALVFAADAPTQAGKSPPHEIHVHVVGREGPGPATVIPGSGDISRAALARAAGGTYGLSFTSAAGVYLARLRCDDE